MESRASSEQSDHKSPSPGGEDSKPKRGGLAGQFVTLATCLSALIAVYAAYTSVNQVDIAKQQNEVSNRQSLAALVNDIAQQTSSLSSANTQQSTVITQARLADAEEAFALVNTLKGSVPAVDNYEIGNAFGDSEENFDALTSLKRAAQVENAPHYRASALRGEAGIFYALGGSANDAQAHADLELAYHAFDGQPDVPKYVVGRNRAFTELFSVERGALTDCSLARAQFTDATHVIHVEPAVVDPNVNIALTGAKHSIAGCR